METPISIRIERVSLQFADGGYGGFGGYRVTIKFADDVGSAVGGGRKTEKVLGGALGGGSGTYTAPQGGGGITSSITVNGKTVNFGHGGRHLNGTGLDINVVNEAIANKVSTIKLGVGEFFKGQIVADGITIEFTSYGVSEGIINVGTYYTIP